MTGEYKIYSFGKKYSQLPPDGVFVYDCRNFRNPYNVASLRQLNGRDVVVQSYMKRDPDFSDMLTKALIKIGSTKTIAFGCLGGKHRSVAAAEIVAKKLRDAGYTVEVHHLTLNQHIEYNCN